MPNGYAGMNAKMISFHQRLEGKVILYLLLPSLLMFALTFYFLGQRALQQAIQHAYAELTQQVQIIAAELEQRQHIALKTAETMALAQQHGLFGQREASSDFAKNILLANPNFTGAYFGYEPNADGQDEAHQAAAGELTQSAQDRSGRFLPYWHRASNQTGSLQLEPMLEHEHSDYYQLPKQLVLTQQPITATITEPYTYEGVQLFEITYPIIINQTFKGIAGVDIALTSFDEFASPWFQQTELILLSAKRNILAVNKRPELLTHAIETTPYAALYQLLLQPEQHFLRTRIEQGPMMRFTLITLPMSNWQLMVGLEESAILAPIYRELMTLLLIVLACFLVVTVFSLWFVKQLSKRLQYSVSTLASVAQGDLQNHRVQQHAFTIAEIDIIDQSCQQLITSSQIVEQQCRRLADGDFSVRIVARGQRDKLAEAINLLADKRQQAEEALKQQTAQLLLAQDDLIEAEKMASLGNLVAGVAHEVNTPLGIAITAASHIEEIQRELLQHVDSQQLSRNKFMAALNTIGQCSRLLDNNLQRAADLISSFKNVAVDQSISECRMIVLSHYLLEVGKGFHHKFKHTAISINVESTRPEPAILTEPGAVAQIYSNLLMNSYIHGFKDGSLPGTISCQLHYAEHEVKVIYTDTGIGMSADVKRQVFEPFYSTNRAAGNSGLGMHIVFNLVTHRLKGKIQCHSDVGDGVTFTITFPINDSSRIGQSNAA